MRERETERKREKERETGPYPETFGTSIFEMVIFPYRHCGCLRVRKLQVFKTSDPLKSYFVESDLASFTKQLPWICQNKKKW